MGKSSEQKVTSKRIAKVASKVLRSNSTRPSKRVAGSALSQALGRRGR